MKKKNIIISLCFLWGISVMVVFFAVYKYIDKKKTTLRCELRDNITGLFQGQNSDGPSVGNNDGFFFTESRNYPVRHYKKVPIPARPDKDFRHFVDEWNKNYSDISTLYELNWGDEYPNQNDEGWNITRIYCGGMDDEFIQTNTIFPYKVGLKKTEFGNYYTVERAVDEAYEFYTTNPKSSFSDRCKHGKSSTIWNEIYAYCHDNEFYTIAEKKREGWKAGTPIYFPKGKSYEEAQRVAPYENGWMHNSFYRVYIAATQERIFGIEEKEWAISSNRNKLLLWWCIGISIAFSAILIPLTIAQINASKKKSETLYQRLVRMCNPKSFMDNYDKNRVSIANSIHKSLMETASDDFETLNQLQARAVEELGISLIEKCELEELKDKVNPKNYMSPYNPDKVALANELYSILTKEGLTYNEMIEVEQKSKKL